MLQFEKVLDCFYLFTYRLLTLWFHYGELVEVCVAVKDSVETIAIDKWIQVIPQLIARIDTTRSMVGNLIHTLLTHIGVKHPQVRGVVGWGNFNYFATYYPLSHLLKNQH